MQFYSALFFLELPPPRFRTRRDIPAASDAEQIMAGAAY